MLVNKISPTRQEACKYDNKRMKNTLECRKINDNYEKTMLEIAWPRTQDKDFFFLKLCRRAMYHFLKRETVQ
jgi:hypothetical protein